MFLQRVATCVRFDRVRPSIRELYNFNKSLFAIFALMAAFGCHTPPTKSL